MHTGKRRVLEILGFVFALGACEGTELPSDHGDSEVAPDSDQVADTGSASPELAEPGRPSVDPAEYPFAPELPPGAEKPCSFGPDSPNRCSLAVEGAGFFPIDSTWPIVIVAGGLSFDGQGRLAGEHGGTANVVSSGAEPQELTVRFGDTISEGEWSEVSSQFAIWSETFLVSQDGLGVGFAEVLAVTWDGWLCVTYSNAETQCPGRLAVALFEAPAHLFEHSAGVWVETPQAGPAALGPALFEGRGGIAGSRLPPSP